MLVLTGQRSKQGDREERKKRKKKRRRRRRLLEWMGTLYSKCSYTLKWLQKKVERRRGRKTTRVSCCGREFLRRGLSPDSNSRYCIYFIHCVRSLTLLMLNLSGVVRYHYTNCVLTDDSNICTCHTQRTGCHSSELLGITKLHLIPFLSLLFQLKIFGAILCWYYRVGIALTLCMISSSILSDNALQMQPLHISTPLSPLISPISHHLSLVIHYITHQDCRSLVAARRLLEMKGVVHYWDMAFQQENDP